jgi:hypothetical protein
VVKAASREPGQREQAVKVPNASANGAQPQLANVVCCEHARSLSRRCASSQHVCALVA